MNNLETMTKLYIRMLAANLIMLAMIIRFYAGPFSLAMDPLSWLGKLVTDEGLPNTLAFILFSATLLYDAFVWRRFLAVLPESRCGRRPAPRLLGRAVLAGFILMAFPCDRFEIIHSIGGGLVVGGFWALTTGLLFSLRDRLGVITHASLQLFLQLAAIYCGYHFAFDTPLKGLSQRPLLLAITGETGLCLNVLLKSRGGNGRELAPAVRQEELSYPELSATHHRPS